jgi:PAS domain S-box-containing protein
MIRRAAIFVFALLAAVLATAVAIDIVAYGRLTLFDPAFLGGFAVIGIGILLADMSLSRDRAKDLQERTGRLTQLIEELENFSASLEAANIRSRANEERYKSLVDAQADAIMRCTPDGRVTYANTAFLKLFMLSPQEAIGQSFKPELHPESPLPDSGRWVGREIGQERISYDQLIKTVVGYRWIAWEDYAIRDTDGTLIEIQSVGRDINERKELQNALTEARDKAEDANRAKSRFLATMSHEIRTPMNGVLGMARLLLETNLAPDQKSYADAIRTSGMSLLALIEDILDFSKIESGTLVIEKSDVALRPLIEGIAELLSTRAFIKHVEIVTTVADNVPDTIVADGVRLRQVITNLVGNAIKFTEHGGVLVTASVEKSPSSNGPLLLTLAVKDTGIGVPKEKQQQIFEDFVQADSSHARRFEGTGLGLSISKRLVNAMGGHIGLSSKSGAGSTFWVTLPLEEAQARDGKRPLKGKQVALISTSPTLREGMRLQLAAAGTELAATGTLAALEAKRDLADFLLVDADWNENEPLPDVSAIGIPAVALLPPGHRAQLQQLSAKGYRAYLIKPVRQDSLERRLMNVDAGMSPEMSVTEQAQETRSRPGLSILLAEDNPVNALLARELLRRRGHRVEQVATGEGAVAAYQRARFDVVIMDLHMPGLDGIEATRRIRAEETKKGGRRLPIFALTADALDTGRKACLAAGMDGFLTKPVDPSELDAVLATISPPANIAAE